jgi:hypothetical protein
MIEIRQLIDDIRQAERELSSVANKRQTAASEVEKLPRPLRSRSLNWSASA